MTGFDHLHVSSYFMQEALRPGCRDLFARARRLGSDHLARPRLRPQRDVGRRPAGDAPRGGPVLPERGGAARPWRARRRRRGPEAARQRRTPAIVAKLGRDGAVTLESGRLLHVPALPVEPLDTTGAGDSFNAGFLHAWLAGAPLVECLRLGAACGALSTLGLGGTARQPTGPRPRPSSAPTPERVPARREDEMTTSAATERATFQGHTRRVSSVVLQPRRGRRPVGQPRPDPAAVGAARRTLPPRVRRAGQRGQRCRPVAGRAHRASRPAGSCWRAETWSASGTGRPGRRSVISAGTRAR